MVKLSFYQLIQTFLSPSLEISHFHDNEQIWDFSLSYIDPEF